MFQHSHRYDVTSLKVLVDIFHGFLANLQKHLLRMCTRVLKWINFTTSLRKRFSSREQKIAVFLYGVITFLYAFRFLFVKVGFLTIFTTPALNSIIRCKISFYRSPSRLMQSRFILFVKTAGMGATTR